jgi:hypothetical protein
MPLIRKSATQAAAMAMLQPELKRILGACDACATISGPLIEGNTCRSTSSRKTFSHITDREAALSRGRNLMHNATPTTRTVPSQTAAIREFAAAADNNNAL